MPCSAPLTSSAKTRAWWSRTASSGSSRSSAYSRIGLEHPEPAVRVARHEALVGERLEAVERVGAAHGFGGVEREAAREHAEAREERLRVGVQQVVAPADRRPQRLLALRRVARAGAEEVEPAAQAVEDLRRRQDLDARRGELDRQWQAVELRADPLDLRDAVELEARVDGAGAADEQRGGGLRGQRRRGSARARPRAAAGRGS